MSFEVFVKKCGTWGLLPNNLTALEAYANMKVMGPMGKMAGFSYKLKKLCMKIPDLSNVSSLEQVKAMDESGRMAVILCCHEILHNLHCAIDGPSFLARSQTGNTEWDNEEEMLTISGDTGTVALPSSVMVACNPKLFNEHSLCRILRLSNRPSHKTLPSDVSSMGNVDLTSAPTGIPFNYSEIYNV